jgi:hypothetical protein
MFCARTGVFLASGPEYRGKGEIELAARFKLLEGEGEKYVRTR